MAIEFRCPNGHRLSCPDDRAGRTGKCPKCGASFQVPASSSASSIGKSETSVTDPAAQPAEKSGEDSGALTRGITEHGDAPDQAPPAHADIVVFLCPNGHRLNCPSSMQGRPGKCPHCGAKFIIPSTEDADVEGPAAEESFLDILAAASDIPADAANGAAANAADPLHLSEILAASANGTTPGGDAAIMAKLFPRLWEQRGDHGVVDLYLKGGEILTPDWYASKMSGSTFGMFALQESDGTYTLTVVNWTSIDRIAVRGVDALPEGVFDIEEEQEPAE